MFWSDVDSTKSAKTTWFVLKPAVVRDLQIQCKCGSAEYLPCRVFRLTHAAEISTELRK
jgi:hypothetical protein